MGSARTALGLKYALFVSDDWLCCSRIFFFFLRSIRGINQIRNEKFIARKQQFTGYDFLHRTITLPSEFRSNCLFSHSPQPQRQHTFVHANACTYLLNMLVPMNDQIRGIRRTTSLSQTQHNRNHTQPNNPQRH